jgi:hypothetical protein
MPQRPNEVFYRIIDDEPAEAGEEDRASFHVNFGTRVLTISSRRMYYRRVIPVGGFESADFMDMAARLDFRPTELATVLSHRRYRGIAGQAVHLLALTHRLRFTPIVFLFTLTQPQQQRNPPRLNAVDAAPPQDEVCVICLETCASTPGQGWSTAEGCNTHRFHTACIGQWIGGTCPICRSELRQ